MAMPKDMGRSRPFRSRLYGWLRLIHLWFTLPAAVPLLVLSLSGAFLVYGHEIEKALAPEIWTLRPQGPRQSFDALLDRVRAQAPDVRVWSIAPGRRPEDAWVLWLADGAGVINLDPYTGDVLARYRPHSTVNGIVTALHRWLLVDGPARPWVRHAVSGTALLLMAQVVTGLWMWGLPARRWRNATPDFSHGPRLAVLRLHQFSGLVTAALLLLVAFTGISLYWIAPTRTLVEAVAGNRIAQALPTDRPGLAPIADLEGAVTLAVSAMPDARLLYVKVPSRPGEPALVTVRTPNSMVPSQLLVGSDPATILEVRDGSKASSATWFWEIRYRLHIGDFAGDGFGGIVVRGLWFLLALMPAFFAATGLWLWLKRRGMRGYSTG